MSEDSEKEDYSDRTISDEDESDEDTFMKFVSEDIHQCALLTADSISDPFFPRTTQILLEYQLGRWVPRLRKPRDLYGVSSSGPLSPTRWPYHCEVVDEKVQHIDWTPSYPEPVYIPTGLEMEPLYPNSKEDTVVYLAEDGNKRGTHFNTKDLESMGYHFCDSLLDYCDPDRTKYYQCLKELEEMEKHINLEKVLDDSDTSLKEITLDLESSSRGSDSSESNDSQTDLLKLSSQIKNKKKHLKTKKERNSTVESHQNSREEEQEVCDKGHLVQRHKESNADVEDLHHNLNSNMKECTSFQSKKAGINWTDDEKRIYRDKEIAQTQEILQYLLPIMKSTKNVQTTQIKQILNPRINFQIQHQPQPSTYINIKKYSTSWTPPRNPPLRSQRNLPVNSSECLQSVSQKSSESLSPLKGPKKKKKHSRAKATKTKDMKHVSGKWETTPSSFEKGADQSLQAEESNQQGSLQTAPHLIKNKGEQPKKKDGQPTFCLMLQTDK
ncbi:cytosolic carboxypeptidase 3 isoform X8 [Camelus bactrianus]|uniref:Cytosolic carboxypeptidase 3 isoform X12 n=1 Tax=Camelus bactrianus TaxID=9837 RepID=A0A9W3HCM2_CAMBA|nr:cytosolic carboxypeptidase 3 isoform X12 [Camelus bactrianus]